MRLLPIDAHTHVDVDLPADELRELKAVLFCMTRSLDEAKCAIKRKDELSIWGVGCHPARVRAMRAFQADCFAKLATQSPLIGEVGYERNSAVPFHQQKSVLECILQTLQQTPRIVSLHSTGMESELIESLTRYPVRGVILHWWRGDQEQTDKALALGCYISVNHSMLRNGLLANIPANRIIPETDYPHGTRWLLAGAQPGNTGAVETRLEDYYSLNEREIRLRFWRNFGQLVAETGTYALLPRRLRSNISATYKA